MSQEGLKLLKNKPKKSQVIKASEVGGGRSSKGVPATSATAASSSVSGAAASYKMGSPPPPPLPPQPPQESFVRRYKFVWPLLLGVNLVVGVYYFMRTKNTATGQNVEVTTNASPTPATSIATATLADKPAPVFEPVRTREPVPENQQRELFKWILDEKRKVKPRDAEEKKRLDEEKAILKQFIRAKSIPSI